MTAILRHGLLKNLVNEKKSRLPNNATWVCDSKQKYSIKMAAGGKCKVYQNYVSPWRDIIYANTGFYNIIELNLRVSVKLNHDECHIDLVR